MELRKDCYVARGRVIQITLPLVPLTGGVVDDTSKHTQHAAHTITYFSQP